MVTLQILNKIIAEQRLDIVINNGLTVEYFPGYENMYNFIIEHVNKYGNIPDRETILSVDPNWQFVTVNEPDKFLIDKCREEKLYADSVGVIQKAAEVLLVNANDAVEYLRGQLQTLQPTYDICGVDIIARSRERYTEHVNRLDSKSAWCIPTGFLELDACIDGLARGEEYCVLVARTNEGKSWILIKMAEYAWRLGERIGYISPEMGASAIGYRFDAVNAHFSNRGLNSGRKTEGYSEYINELETKDGFIVARPQDFDKKITVSKLRQFCIQNKLTYLCIDGITYLSDERYRKGDMKTTTLTNISEDLMELSIELKLPIIVVVQAGRDSVKNGNGKEAPELDTIRDSDGIAYNASKVISIKQRGPAVELIVKKARTAARNQKVVYRWMIDTGEFTYIPTEEEVQAGGEVATNSGTEALITDAF